MQLSDILQVECVKVPLEAQEKYEAIRQLLDALYEQGRFESYDDVLKAVMERESIRSTGIGQGFAIPHGKCSAVPRLVMAVGKLDNPIDFESIDGKPVSIILLLISPADQTGPHIQALARISRLMADDAVREKLVQASDSQTFYDLLNDFDAQNDS